MSKLSSHWKRIRTLEGLKTPSERGRQAAKVLMAHKEWWKRFYGIKEFKKDMSVEEVAIILEAGNPKEGVKSWVESVIEMEGVNED